MSPAPRRAARTVSIVVPSWNGRSLLERFLPGVVRAAKEAEIVVVDDGSTDDTARWVTERFPGVRLVRGEENLGFIEAVRRGVETARGDVVVLLNNDVAVEEGFFEAALPHFDDPEVFAVALRSRGDDGERFREGAKFARWRMGFLRVEHDLGPAHRALEAPTPTLYAVGGHAAYRRERFLALGGFSSLYRPFYFEDLDLSVRGWRAGWKVVYEPRASVVHPYHSVEGTIRTRFGRAAVRRIRARNRLLFHWRHLEGMLDWAVHVASLLGRVAIAAVTEPSEALGFLGALGRIGEVRRARAFDRSLLRVPLRAVLKGVGVPPGWSA